MTAAASGTMVWAWMSTVLTRLPLTTTSRRLPWRAPGPGVPEAFDRLHPTNARPANAPAINSPEIGISVLLQPSRHWSAAAYYGFVGCQTCLNACSVRRSGISQISATSVYSATEIQGLTSASNDRPDIQYGRKSSL